jgi:hypothetical protein
MKAGFRLGRVVALALLLVGAPRTVEAGPFFVEEFVFPDASFPGGIPAGQQWYIGTELSLCGGTPTCQSTAAEILFDLTSLVSGNPANVAGLEGQLIDTSLNPIVAIPNFETHAPDTDADGYVAGSGLAGATLTLRIRGLDSEDDSVLVTAFAADGGATLFQHVFTGSLGSTSVVIPFDAGMLASLAGDGMFGIRLSSFGGFESRDFNLESARLEATAVPEPATVSLVAAGVAAALARRRRRRRV